jgi:hypothetical protein
MSAQGSKEAEVNGGPESWRGVLPQKALAIELTEITEISWFGRKKIQLLFVFRVLQSFFYATRGTIRY